MENLLARAAHKKKETSKAKKKLWNNFSKSKNSLPAILASESDR